MLKIGVIGAGHIGKIHLKLLLELKILLKSLDFTTPIEKMRKLLTVLLE